MNNVLIFYNYFTPAYKAGGPIQSINSMIRALSEDYNFNIFCSDVDHDGTHLNVQTDTWLPFNQSKVLYATSRFLKAESVNNLIKETKPRVLFINGIYSWYFNMLPLLRSKGVRKIVSVRGMLHPGALSQKAFKKKLYLIFWKFLGLHKRCEFHATTIDEKHFIEKVFGTDITTWVAGNFPNVLDYQQAVKKRERSLILISVALVSPMKNHLLVLQALKDIRVSIEYKIYGPIKDTVYWKQCEELLKLLPANVKVVYAGEVVPALIPDALKEADVFILPSKSENFGHAIYEAMTAGKPVITSHNTPWNDLTFNKAGVNVSIENSTEIRNAIEFFAEMDNDTIEDWSKSTREYALKAVDVKMIKQQYLDMFNGTGNSTIPLHEN